jgi:hypothetical protein
VKFPDCPDIAGFTWDEYLSKTKSQPVPARAFKPVSYSGLTFEARMGCNIWFRFIMFIMETI